VTEQLITVEMPELKGLMTRLSQLERELKDLRPELKAAGKVQAKAIAKRFDQGGIPEWEDITHYTRKRRKANETGLPMTEFGRLSKRVASLRSGVQGSAFLLTPTSLQMGSTEKRASALQNPKRTVHVYDEEGKKTGMMRRMPARPFLYVDPADEPATISAVGESLEQRLRKKFGGAG
jgi:phage gpG-like protein